MVQFCVGLGRRNAIVEDLSWWNIVGTVLGSFGRFARINCNGCLSFAWMASPASDTNNFIEFHNIAFCRAAQGIPSENNMFVG